MQLADETHELLNTECECGHKHANHNYDKKADRRNECAVDGCKCEKSTVEIDDLKEDSKK